MPGDIIRRRGRYAGVQFQFSQTEAGTSSSAQQPEASSAVQHSEPCPSSSAQHDPPVHQPDDEIHVQGIYCLSCNFFLFHFMYIYDIVTFMYFLQTDPGEYAPDADPQ